MSEQQGWRWCRKCQSSCYGGLVGVCAAGGPHDFQGSAWYAMPSSAPDKVYSQEGWRWCNKCQILFHPGLGVGCCPAGGGHDSTGSGTYFLAVSPYPLGGQEGWRYCPKCHALHLTGSGSGPCPAGGEHTSTGSGSYSLLLGTAPGCSIPSHQAGWRRCCKCHASCYGGLPGCCAAGGLHDFQGSAWYGIPLSAPTGGSSQEGWRWCSKCQVLFHPGLGLGSCPAGGGHDSAGSGAYLLAFSPYVSKGQEGWRYCSKCHALQMSGADPGRCPAGGDHTDVGSLPYSMLLTVPAVPSDPPYQLGWRRCHKCHASCYAGLPGVCMAGGRHDFQGSAWYAMPTAVPSGVHSQDGWRWCSKCQVLFHPGLGAGLCPTGGGHDATGSGAYFLACSSYASDGQEGWRYCPKCHALHLTGAGPGCCPAGGDHTDTGSGAYSMRLGAPSLPPVQSVWRRCGKCQTSCYGGLTGSCAAGGPHDFQGSLSYTIPTAVPSEVPGQEGWRWCSKCQTMFHPGLGAGVCPRGSGHDATGSGPYWLAYSPYPVGGQEGWRYCAKCHSLHLSSAGPGTCPAGGNHTETGSLPYSMKLDHPIETQCRLIVDYDANRQPQSRFEVVLIPRSADGATLPGSVVQVLAGGPVNIIREEGGVVTYQGLNASTPVLFTTSAIGRVRFSIVPPHDKLMLPNLFAHSVAMPSGQWVEFSPDDDLHAKLSDLTGTQLITAPAGKAGSLLPSSRMEDAQALAAGVKQLMSRWKPQAPIAPVQTGPLSFDVWDDIGGSVTGAAGTVGGAISGAAGTVGGAISGVAQKTAEVATSVASTIATQSQFVVGSAAQLLDTVGAAAQILVKNVDIAVPHVVQDFAAQVIPAATQLAIDVSRDITVIALVVVNGVQSIVKTVVQTVESAALMVGAFFQRVGLQIKQVIDFLASLFDWDAILQLQGQIQDALNDRLASFGSIVSQQRTALPGYLRTLESMIAGLSSNAAEVPRALPGSMEISSIGGQFGYLMDKLTSAIGGLFGLPIDLGLGAVASFFSSLTGAVIGELEAFLAMFLSSPLCAALADPKKLIGLGPQALLALIKPLATAAIKVVAVVADAALAIAPPMMSGIQAALRQRISIPLLTDFIELVVFRNKQQLCLESLLTLMTAALTHIARKLGDSLVGGAVSFAVADDMQQAGSVLAWWSTVLTLIQALMAGWMTPSPPASTGWLSLVGFASVALSTPYLTSGTSFRSVEQWLCWILNLISSLLSLLGTDRGLNAVNAICDPDVAKKAMARLTKACGVIIIGTGAVCNGLALSSNAGDTVLTKLDLSAQVIAGVSNLTADWEPSTALGATAVLGLAAASIGATTWFYSNGHPDASLA